MFLRSKTVYGVKPTSYFNMYREIFPRGKVAVAGSSRLNCFHWQSHVRVDVHFHSLPYNLRGIQWDRVYRLKHFALSKSSWNPLPSLGTVSFRWIQRDALSELNELANTADTEQALKEIHINVCRLQLHAF